MRHISLDLGSDGIATLMLDHATESMNLVSAEWVSEMEAAIAAIAADPAITGVILTSAKPAFMAGADLKQLVGAYETRTAKQAFDFSWQATRMHRAIELSGKPWVAALNGLALGGGFELALACHGRILVEDPKAVVGLPEVNVGLLPGSGGTQRLPRIAGIKTALDLLLSGRTVGGTEALALGLVDQIVAREDLIQAARDWLAAHPDPVKPWDIKGYAAPGARGLLDPDNAASFAAAAAAAAKRGANLPAPAAIVSCVFEGLQLPIDKALSVESKYFALLLTGPVARNIIRTTFISKAAAEKGAGRPAGVPKFRAEKVGVLGAGMMGSGIALVSAISGAQVVLIDRDVASAEAGKAYSAKALARDVDKGKRDQAAADQILARITATDDFALLAGSDIVIEAVFENTEIKNETTRKAEAVIPAAAISATNTSTLPITGLAEASQRPDQFIGMHFFSPVDRMGLVEVIRGRKTSPETLAKALDFVAQLRKTPIVANDSRGFYTSRVFAVMTHEGGAMLAEGVPPAVIENAARQIGMPVGPLALQDEVSFDLPLKIIDQAAAEVEGYTPPAGSEVLRRMRDELGRGGRKTGGGYYDYPEGGKKRLWPQLAEHFPQRSGYDVEDIKKRLLYIQAIESARCIEEGVLTTPEDADLGSVYGWGVPAWTGGTISYIDTIGIQAFVREADRLAQEYGPRFAPSAWLRARAERNEPFYKAAEATEPACAA
ncbi:MAG: 3-hydroxyacyl-CoA dehydrogenase [Sphingomonadales bacterium]|nr:MAG: 3-hydroxyacyl-CoA dehydrogenase [Sphingomonadales bacterium]